MQREIVGGTNIAVGQHWHLTKAQQEVFLEFKYMVSQGLPRDRWSATLTRMVNNNSFFVKKSSSEKLRAKKKLFVLALRCLEATNQAPDSGKITFLIKF